MNIQFFNETLKPEAVDELRVVRYYTCLGKNNIMFAQHPGEVGYRLYMCTAYLDLLPEINDYEIIKFFKKVYTGNGRISVEEIHNKEILLFIKHYKEQYEKYEIFE
jgi:hypothetical protein